MSLSLTNTCVRVREKDAAVCGCTCFLEGWEETVQECRIGEEGICVGAGRGKLQVTGRE